MNAVTKLTWGRLNEMLLDTARFPAGTYYGVPRGGAIVAGLLDALRIDCEAVHNPEAADHIVDDIIDSGDTAARYIARHKLPFRVVVDKNAPEWKSAGWIQFPWEEDAAVDAESSVRRLLQVIDPNPNREGLRETPKRVVKAWLELTEGYHMSPKEILAKDFEGSGYDEMVCMTGIEFYSSCEHHLLPFTGQAHVAYLPNSSKPRVVGISKLARLVDCYARRLQIQEQMTAQIADALMEHLGAAGAGVVIEAGHFCMKCRGVKKQNSTMVTSALRGCFKEGQPRAEFLSLVNMGRSK